MADKKLTTEEILALARKQKAGGGAETPPAEAPSSEAAPESPAPAPAPKPAGNAPKSTADILAAARAQATAKSAPAEESKAAPAAPKSTADILAAARSQGATKPAGGAAPKSTADILAAARAAGGAAASPKPKAAAESAPAAKAPAAAPAGMGVKDMVAAVKQAQQGGAPPKLPAKPAAPKLPVKQAVPRRGILATLAAITISPFTLGWTSLGGVLGLWGLAMARFLMPNMVRELPSKFTVGSPSDYPPGTVSEKYTASRGIWIVNTDQYNGKPLLYALASVCTHLGCTPSWLAGEQKFKCPCHGSGFYITGINFEGPAPRPLERVGLSVAPSGLLEVDKSVKFQEELGQWTDGKSFVEVG
ncbi:MAG: Rieske 2Fe-2S domain-containing protein [Planctomycetaceae bacterium]|nr:Rieske 2Fe-2S domain-containing protein [Planctomycetaceae bacterium]